LRRHTLLKISPSFPSGPEALWAGGQRGGIPPFGKGREGGIYPQCLYNYGLTNKIESIIEKKMEIPFDP